MMDATTTIDQIQVPEALLKSKELLPSTKLVWMALMLDISIEPQQQLSKSRLAAMTGLSRPTIYKAIAALQAGGWYSTDKPCRKKLRGPSVTICTELLMNHDLSVQARLLHGLLQLTPSFKRKINDLRYSSLSYELQIGIKTIRNAVKQLIQSGWLVMKQAKNLAPFTLALRYPVKEPFSVMQARAKKNLDDAKHVGEALMKEFLSVIISSDGYVDNAKPGFLRNIETDCLLEYDRYYPKIAAFEFNGPQHYKPTEFYDAEKVKKQQIRDKMKKQLSDKNRVKLVIIHPEDLTIAGMLSKIGSLLPLRNLNGGERLIKYLEKVSACYRRKCLI